MSAHAQTKAVTTATFQARKQQAEKIAMLTAYDFPSAQLADEAGIDCILVGDSLGNVIKGERDTLGVTMDEMTYHTRLVSRGVQRAMVVADMPFLSYQLNPEQALANAGRLVSEGGAQAVKLEGSSDDFGGAMQAMLRAGIPVMGHLGLTPQSVHRIGGYRVQGRDTAGRERIGNEAKRLEEIGCFAIVLECVPSDLAAEITQAVSIPTIGIGAGAGCDGQVLVMHDILGWGKTRFCKAYADVRGTMRQAFETYKDEVKSGAFPTEEQSFQ